MDSEALLYEEVAQHTGEDRGLIASLGFQANERPLDEIDPPEDRPPLMIDWDAVQGRYGRSWLPIRAAQAA